MTETTTTFSEHDEIYLKRMIDAMERANKALDDARTAWGRLEQDTPTSDSFMEAVDAAQGPLGDTTRERYRLRQYLIRSKGRQRTG